MKKPPPIKIVRKRRPRPILPSPYKPRADMGEDPELLGGMVQNKKASAPEERMAKALSKIPTVEDFSFRYTIGAPRGMPGWKELDYLVMARGLTYAIEVDTAFTHMGKSGRTDVLHDAIVLKDLMKQGMNVYPKVLHWFGENELVDQKSADRTAKELFG